LEQFSAHARAENVQHFLYIFQKAAWQDSHVIKMMLAYGLTESSHTFDCYSCRSQLQGGL